MARQYFSVRWTSVIILLFFDQDSWGFSQEPKYTEGPNSNLGEALQFLREFDREGSNMCFRVTSAQWNFSTNITDTNKRRMLEEQALQGKFERISWRKATSFSWTHLPDPLARRQLRMLAIEGRSALSEEKFTELQQLVAEMKDIYSRARICPYNSPRLSGYCDLSLEPDLTRTLAQSRDYEEQLHIWRSWREAVGPPIRSKFIRYVHLANQAAKLNGFQDAGHQQRAVYEDDNFESHLSEVWAMLAPLYKQLHAYVRRRLVERYGSQKVRPDGPIPAHLSGNMWAQNWKNLYELVQPFPNRPIPDGTRELLRQGYTSLRMFQLAEEFFTSMGMRPMPPEFWQHSMLERPLDRDVVCKASAWDFCNHKDYRIKHCTRVTMDDLLTIHHEMAHIQYYLQYSDQPLLFRDGANPGFHEAIGDVIGLSVSNPRHLHRIGIIHNSTDDYETNINYLLKLALEKVAYAPFAFVVDQWRWGVFKGIWTVSEMNSHWWELRLRHQGVIPPVTRSDQDFDPASKYHIPADMPYIRYFVSLILQFQIHESLCLAGGHIGPLHTCDIYRSREAGRLLAHYESCLQYFEVIRPLRQGNLNEAWGWMTGYPLEMLCDSDLRPLVLQEGTKCEMLNQGSSRPWNELIRTLTRGRTDKLDARPMLEFFQPLAVWLSTQNREQNLIGWSTTVQDTALFARWSRGSSTTLVPSAAFTLSLVVMKFLLQ